MATQPYVPTLSGGISRLKTLRDKNPSFSSLSDREFAEMAYKQQPEPELGEYLKSSSLSRGAAHLAGGLDTVGKKVSPYAGEAGRLIGSLVGEGEFGQKVGERASEQLIRSSPHMLLGGLSGLRGPISKVARVALPVASGTLEYGMTMAEQNDTRAALGAGVGTGLSIVGGLSGAKLAHGAAGRAGAGALGRGAAGSAGAVAGSIPGDLLEIGTSDRSKGFLENIEDFFSDPVEVAAYGIMQAVFGPVMDISRTIGQVKKEARQKKLSEILSAGETFARDAEDELAALTAIPYAQRSPENVNRMTQLASRLRQNRDVELRERMQERRNATFKTVPESYETLRVQHDLLSSGRRPVLMVPQGSALPSHKVIPYPKVTINGDTFYYDKSQISEAQIKTAVRTKKLGTLLGYGIDEAPVGATEAVTIRTKDGLEKLSVEVDEASKLTVQQNLQKFMDPTDTMAVESKEALVKERLSKRDREAIHFSLSLNPESDFTPTAPVDPTLLTRHQFENVYEGQIPVEVKLKDGTISKGIFNGYYDWRDAGLGMKVSVGLPIMSGGKTEWSHGMFDVADLVSSSQPLPSVTEWNKTQKPRFSLSFRDREDAVFWNSGLKRMEGAFKATDKKGARFQPDAEGNVSTAGLSAALKNWFPKEIYTVLNQAGLPNIMVGEKVKVQDVIDFVRENSPTIEVKKLVPAEAVGDLERRMAALQHEFETAGFRVTGSYVYEGKVGQESRRLDTFEGPWQAKAKEFFDLRSKAFAKLESSDAATGRYGVEPIPVQEMDRPVDILVRVPRKEFKTARDAMDAGKTVESINDDRTATERALFRGPHFGNSDVNVIASLRGYFVGDTFFVFEVQSDWGQLRRKEKIAQEDGIGTTRLTDDEADVVMDARNNKVKYHPLLDSYNTLAVKAAIKHALENGASKVAFADSETVLFNEGQTDMRDRFIAGHKQAYDVAIKSISEKLTQSKAQKEEMGKFSGSDFANKVEPNTKPIIAWTFPLDNLHPSVEDLFSFSLSRKQVSHESVVAQVANKLSAAFARGETLSSTDLINRLLSETGPVDYDIMAKALLSMRASPGTLRTFNLDQINGIKVLGTEQAGQIGVNLTNRSSQQILGTMAHEFSHPATNDFQVNLPEAYETVRNFLNAQEPQARLQILKELADTVGISDVDIEYGAGLKVPLNPDQTVYEFVATINELMTRGTFGETKLPKFFEALEWLPAPILEMVKNAYRYFRSYTTAGYPSMMHYFNEEASPALLKSLDITSGILYRREQRENSLYAKISALKDMDFSSFADRAQDASFGEGMKNNLSGQRGEMRNFSLQMLEEGGLINKAGKIYEGYFLPALFRARNHPFTLALFNLKRHFRNNIKLELEAYYSSLGQDVTGSLTKEAALKNANDQLNDILYPSSKNQARLDKMTRIIEENQNRRQRIQNEENRFTTEADLVSVEDMVNRYGLSEEDAAFLDKITKIPQAVAEQVIANQELADTAYTARLFLAQNKGLNMEANVKQSRVLTRLAGEHGQIRMQREYYTKILDREMRKGRGDTVENKQIASEIDTLKIREDAAKMELEEEIRRLYRGQIPLDEQFGQDQFINQMVEVMMMFGANRAKMRFATMDEGYAPMTRRGRFLLRVYGEDAYSKEFGLLKEARGFKTKKEALGYIKENELNGDQFELLDKEVLKDRYKSYYPRSLQNVQEKARAELTAHIADIVANLPDSPVKQAQVNVLNQALDGWRPIEDMARETLAVKGDKFAERRYAVEGFERSDFIQNIFEYMNYKTVSSQRALTRAQAALELTRPEYDSNPQIKEREEAELDYVLNHTNEAPKSRNFIYNFYLGGSIRHFMQNITQVPLTGIPQLISEGAGIHAYKHWTNGMRLANKFLWDGTTGDKVLDSMLKEAEEKGVTIPSTIEYFAPEKGVVDQAMDNVAAWEKGGLRIGDKVNYGKSRFVQGMMKGLRATAVSSEIINRRTSFIMRYLESKRQGVTDAKTIYDQAAQFTDFTNFVGDKSNRPGFLSKIGFDKQGNPTYTHGVMVTATALQSFVLNQIGQIYSFGKKGFLQGSTHDKAAFATSLAHLIVFAGAFGLIGAELAEQLFEKATGISLRTAIRNKIVKTSSEVFDTSEETGGRISDAVLYGLPGLIGLDASQSLGLGNPLINYRSERPMSALDLAGPLGGIIERGTEAASILANSQLEPAEILRAARVASPQALTYWFRMTDALKEGAYLNRKMQPTTESLDVGGSIATVTGFSPMQATHQREYDRLIRKNKTELQADYDLTARLVAQHLNTFEDTGNQSNLNSANAHFREFIQKHGGAQDRGTLISSIVREKQAFRQNIQDDPSAKEMARLEEIMSSYPEVKALYQSRVSSALDELEVAQLLGQPDILERKAESLQRSFQLKLLYDTLVEGGLLPPEASVLSQLGTGSQSERLIEQLLGGLE